MTSSPAPIALFAFKRAQHTQRALEALAGNAEWQQSPLFIYCDGARQPGEQAAVEQTRAVVRAFAHPHKVIIEAPSNQGLAASIRSGVTALCERFGRVVVVEDDLIVSPVFLSYMNQALERYQADARVMQISGHMFPVDLAGYGSAVLLPFTTTWGWATWQRAWVGSLPQPTEAVQCLAQYGWRHRFDINGAYPYARMLVDQMRGRKDSWGIWWYFHVFRNGGLTLYPTRTLVQNEGFDGSGTHCGTWRQATDGELGKSAAFAWPAVAETSGATAVLRAHLLRSRGMARLVKDRWKRAFPGLPAAAHSGTTA